MQKKEITIAFCGDIMLGRNVAPYMGEHTVSDWVSGVSNVWKEADLLIGNLECPCIKSATPVKKENPELVLHAHASRLAELQKAGFSAVTLANNHILDCGPTGLTETIQSLDEAGIKYAGAGMNLSEALAPAFIPVDDYSVGLIAFSYGPPASTSCPGVAPHTKKLMKRALNAARAKADLVIAALHDGLEYSDVPPKQTREKFLFLAKNGADIVIGHHPHVLQGLEWVGEVPIAYSLGDFIFDNSLPNVAEQSFSRMAFGTRVPNEVAKDPHKFSRGAILTVKVFDRSKTIQWHPFYQSANLRPLLSEGIKKNTDLDNIENLSRALVNKDDPRHALAESVLQAAWDETRDDLKIGDLMKMVMHPKWRYIPEGMRYLYRRGLKATQRDFMKIKIL
jgi:poly-gamma-glutamate synthesis protein (capsule biosynthesis protein)